MKGGFELDYPQGLFKCQSATELLHTPQTRPNLTRSLRCILKATDIDGGPVVVLKKAHAPLDCIMMISAGAVVLGTAGEAVSGLPGC